jgi:hypothetical protein
LKALIEAEATVLGFFGLIAVYFLTSYDSRIDRVEEKILDLKSNLRDDQVSVDTIKIDFESLKQKIIKRKRRTVEGILSSLAGLVMSFLLSIYVLGLVTINPQAVLAYQLSVPASMFLFIGIFGIFIMFYRMRKEPE